MDYLLYLVVSIVVFIIGLGASALGVGGGFLIVPTLVFTGFSVHSAIGTSVATIMFTGLSSSMEYYRQGRVDWKLGLLLESMSIPGAILGAYATQFVSAQALKFIFALMLFPISLIMMKTPSTASGPHSLMKWKREVVDKEGEEFIYEVDTVSLLFCSFLVGLTSGFFGVSGGILKVPMLAIFGVPVHVAIATSSLMLSITSLSAFASHALLNNVRYEYLILLVPAVVMGAQFGARFSRRTRSYTLKWIFSLMLTGIAITMLLEEFIRY